MNKRQAKKIIYQYLIATLMSGDISMFITAEAGDNEKDQTRLGDAAEEIMDELERRAEEKK